MATTPLEQNGDFSDNMSVENLLCLDSSDAYDELGEPDILPRIGDQYQLQIPPSIGGESSNTRNSTEVHSEENFFVGLPVPLVWMTLEQDTCEERNITSDLRSLKDNIVEEKEYSKDEIFGIYVEPSHYSVDNSMGVRESESVPSEDKVYLSSNQCKFFLVPELHSESWSDIEKDSFLLGLYIFEKNFVLLRKFIGGKKMDAISSFYYGKFYGSNNHRRWSEGRKMRNKRCVYGHKIFSGLRHQELLSRILPHISQECQSSLLEVSKSFAEGTTSLQDYIFSLKSMVGMNVLVEAIAIGKGKQDLTGMALETPKSNQVRPEIPTGQAWSSLKASEIVKFLTGDYRLSKARSNDLFWEAVWPRLLARGWHSEKSKDEPHIAGLKHGLVFLIPGIKKFSRKKLVKGDHYFDSVSDVLGKVAKEPELVKLEEEEDADGFSFNKDKEQDENNLPTRQRHCYLQPRIPNRSVQRMTFTVVDTSLIDGKPYILRELRSLPFEISNMLTTKTRPEVTGEESTDESTEESEPVNNVDVDSRETTKSSDAPSQDNNTISPEVHNILLSSLKNGNDIEEEEEEEKPSKHEIYSRRRRKQKQENVDSIAPVAKRDKLSSTSSSKGSSIGSVETDTPLKPCTQTSIDLNFPQVPLEMENGLLQTESQNSSAIEASSYEQQPSVDVRRHGTRNRAPTSRALEALANGFLTVNRRQKSKSTSR